MVNIFTGAESLNEKATMRQDAAAVLDRLAREAQKPPSTLSAPATANNSGVDFNASDC